MSKKEILPEDKPLTKKETLFVDYLFICGLNGYAAAVKAGFSERSGYTIASQLLRKVNIAKVVEARLNEVHLSADEALAILAKHARGDIGDLMEITPLGYTINLEKAKANGLTGLIKKIEQQTITINGRDEDKEIHTEKIELHDPQSAIRDILRVHGKIKEPNLTINVKLTDD